jgi:transcription initiation factor TFIIB
MLSEISKICPICSGHNIIQDLETGEIVCQDCGFVQNTDTMNRGQEWRAFTLEDLQTKPRTGAPLISTIPDKGLSSTITLSRDHHTKSRPLWKNAKTRYKSPVLQTT